VLPTYVLRVCNRCGIVLVIWFWREKVFGVTYVLSVQYSCAVLSIFWLWQGIVLKMRTPFDFLWAVSTKNLIGLFYYDSLANVCILQYLTLFYSVAFYSVSFSCTTQIHKLKFKSEYYLRINMWNCVKMWTPALYTMSKKNSLGLTKRTLCGIVLFKLNTFFSHVFACP
jgi:hypothetical protein